MLSGYAGWGLFPLYWSMLAHLNPLEITLHRILWSVPVLLLLVYLVKRRRAAFSAALKNRKALAMLTISAMLITVNWGVYVWAVAHERIIEASMGYFLTPLLNVLGGVLVFHERLKKLQWFAVACAAAGVLYYIATVSVFPWVGLTVGLSFSAYGIMRKQVAVDAVPGLLVETMILAPVALVAIFWLTTRGDTQFLQGAAMDDLWLVLGGAVTVAPLALFTAGTRLLPMTTVGILFYLTPTMQFLAGAFVLGEPLDVHKLIGFGGIWLGLVFYTLSLLRGKPAMPVSTTAGSPR